MSDVAHPQLGPDWRPGPDGLPFRRGARVLLLDDADRLLMVRGHDLDDPSRAWWFTVGGGIDAGETPQQAAARELREETGIRLGADELEGPVLRRSAVFRFLRQQVRQEEEFFLARTRAGHELSRAGWTSIERQFMDDARWWPLPELAAVTEDVFPVGLVELVSGLLDGWDGRLRRAVEH